MKAKLQKLDAYPKTLDIEVDGYARLVRVDCDDVPMGFAKRVAKVILLALNGPTTPKVANGRQKSTALNRAQLIGMIEVLRGQLYTELIEVDPDDPDTKRILDATAFDVVEPTVNPLFPEKT